MARTPWAPGAPALAAAARAIDAVVWAGQSVETAVSTADGMDERSAVRAITLGTLRWYLRLAPAIEALLTRPEGVQTAVRALLAAAAHQIEYSRSAAEATVHLAVDAARLLGAERATGLTNAVLRRFVTERAALLGRVDAHLAGRTAHREWFVQRLLRVWPDQAVRILEANNLHPPMTLRLDLSRTSRVHYLDRLRAAQIEAHTIQWLPSGVILARPLPITEIPGFEEGLVSIQDAGAQLAPSLMDLKSGQRVLDACAAPGGKTGQLLEQGVQIDLTAVDIGAARVAMIEENLQRLQRTAALVVADLRAPAGFANEAPYQRILVDAPCSSTGVIRRHPDIKLLRRSTDIAAFATGQLAILRSCVAMLAPGGRLVYSTCSVLPAENEQVVAALLEEEPAVRVAPMPPAGALAPGALDRAIGVQLLPGGQAGTDGFYYACLEKTTAGT